MICEVEAEYAPSRLASPQRAIVLIVFYLIPTRGSICGILLSSLLCREIEHLPVTALVHVLVNVLAAGDAYTNLHVDVTIEPNVGFHSLGTHPIVFIPKSTIERQWKADSYTEDAHLLVKYGL